MCPITFKVAWENQQCINFQPVVKVTPHLRSRFFVTSITIATTMAKKNLSVVHALRRTAEALRQSSEYQWGHMGSCNCGYLAQQITKLKKNQIHSFAMQRYGDWNEQLNDYCPTSGLPMDDLISEMINFGFDTDAVQEGGDTAADTDVDPTDLGAV